MASSGKPSSSETCIGLWSLFGKGVNSGRLCTGIHIVILKVSLYLYTYILKLYSRKAWRETKEQNSGKCSIRDGMARTRDLSYRTRFSRSNDHHWPAYCRTQNSIGRRSSTQVSNTTDLFIRQRSRLPNV
jgi:hypothetical protein